MRYSPVPVGSRRRLRAQRLWDPPRFRFFESRFMLVAWVVGDIVPEGNALDLFRDLAILDFALKRNELPLRSVLAKLERCSKRIRHPLGEVSLQLTLVRC
jgi:hypothetical protein